MQTKDAKILIRCSSALRQAIESEARQNEEALSVVVRRRLLRSLRQDGQLHPQARAHG